MPRVYGHGMSPDQLVSTVRRTLEVRLPHLRRMVAAGDSKEVEAEKVRLLEIWTKLRREADLYLRESTMEMHLQLKWEQRGYRQGAEKKKRQYRDSNHRHIVADEAAKMVQAALMS